MKLLLFAVVLIKLVYLSVASSSSKNVLWDYTATPEHIHQTQTELTRSYMNTSVNPCEDFFEYACGNWANVDPLNAEYGNVGLVMKQKINKALEHLLTAESDELTSTLTVDEIISENKAKHYYASCMNAVEHFDVEVKAALDFLQTLKGWPMVASGEELEMSDWMKLTTYLQKFDQNFFLSMKFDVNENDEHVVRLYFEAKSRKTIPKNSEVLLNKMENIYGQGFVSIDILDDVVNFNKQIYQIQSRHQTQKFPMERLRKDIPEINWYELYLQTFDKYTDFTDIVETDYFQYAKSLAALLKTTPPRTVINFILFRFAYNLIDVLDQDWNINHKYSTRSEYCLEKLHENMDDIMSRMFARRYYDTTSRDLAGDLFSGVDRAFIEFIKELEWADKKTKSLALYKLHLINETLGYDLEDYVDTSSYPDIQNDSFFQNSLRLIQYRIQKEHDNYRVKSNKHISTVIENDVDYFVENGNQIDMSTGLFQVPIFNKYSPKYSNYGKAAYLIAHGLVYGFSPRYIRSIKGVESNWWNSRADGVYRYTLECFVAQYNKYKWIDVDVPVNGERTLDENVADNVGVQLAYEAYMDWLSDHIDSEENKLLSEFNLTGEQLFFVSFAQTTCSTSYQGKRTSDLNYSGFDHVPTYQGYKVHGVLSNSEAFSKAFHCPITSPMNPARKCKF